MAIAVLSILLIYVVDIIIVGIVFRALSHRFNWNISPFLSLLILVICFAFYENDLLPLAYSLDATITIRNEAISSFLEIPSDYPLIYFFEFSLLSG